MSGWTPVDERRWAATRGRLDRMLDEVISVLRKGDWDAASVKMEVAEKPFYDLTCAMLDAAERDER